MSKQTCDTCGGSGDLCENCSEPDFTCVCDEDCEFEPCYECGGSGEVDEEEDEDEE